MGDVVAELDAEVKSFIADISAKVATLGDTIASLEAKIVAMPPAVDTSVLQADMDALKAAHAALVPPVPAAD